MRRLLLSVTVVLLLSTFAAAQSGLEVFGGYSYFSADGMGFIDRQGFHGWNGELAGRVAPHFSLVGDVGGQYKSEEVLGVKASAKMHSFLAGPRATFGTDKASPFVNALVGFVRSSGEVAGIDAGSDNSFALALGGGVDVKVAPAIAIRVIKADYFVIRDSGESFNNYRVTAGVVFRFGM